MLLRAGSVVAAVSFGPVVSDDDIKHTSASMAATGACHAGPSTLRSIGVQTKQAARSPGGDAGEDEGALL